MHYFDIPYDIKCRESSCNSSQLTRNGPLRFCDGRAGEPRGVVFLPVRLDNGTEECSKVVNGSALVDKQPPPMNCEASNPRM